MKNLNDHGPMDDVTTLQRKRGMMSCPGKAAHLAAAVISSLVAGCEIADYSHRPPTAVKTPAITSMVISKPEPIRKTVVTSETEVISKPPVTSELPVASEPPVISAPPVTSEPEAPLIPAEKPE